MPQTSIRISNNFKISRYPRSNYKSYQPLIDKKAVFAQYEKATTTLKLFQYPNKEQQKNYLKIKLLKYIGER